MRPFTRLTLAAGLAAAAALLAACGHYPPTAASPSYPNVYPPRSTTSVGTAPVSLEYGRVTSIEYVPAGTQAASGPNVIGAVVGGVAGAVLGRQIGGGSGRDAATVLGGVAGAAAGSQVGRDSQGVTTAPITFGPVAACVPAGTYSMLVMRPYSRDTGAVPTVAVLRCG